MFAEFDFDGRAMAALERLTIGTGFSIFSQTDFATFYEQPAAFRRAAGQAKSQRPRGGALAGDLPEADRSLPGKNLPAASLGGSAGGDGNAFVGQLRRSFRAYSDAQKIESETLLAVLDAELSARKSGRAAGSGAGNRASHLQRQPGADPAEDAEQQVLRVQAQVGFGEELDDPTLAIAVGEGFAGRIARTGEPAILPDLRASACGRLDPVLQGQGKGAVGRSAEIRTKP